jgi:hypothetical protein
VIWLCLWCNKFEVFERKKNANIFTAKSTINKLGKIEMEATRNNLEQKIEPLKPAQ